MNAVQEAYEELILREDQVILQIKTSEWAVSIPMDEILYRHRRKRVQKSSRSCAN